MESTGEVKTGGSSILEGTGYPSMREQPSAPNPPPDLGPTLDYPSMTGAKRFEDADRPQQQDARGRLVEADGKVSKMVSILPESPTPGELRDYRQAMGIPERPDGYEIDRGSWPADIGFYPERAEADFKQFAHENHMTPAQVQAAYNWYMGNLLPPDTGYRPVSTEEGESSLRREWGVKLEGNLKLSQETFERFADDSIIEKFEQSRLGDDPDLIKLFYEIGQELKGEKRATTPRRAKAKYPSNVKLDAYDKPRLLYPTMKGN